MQMNGASPSELNISTKARNQKKLAVKPAKTM